MSAFLQSPPCRSRDNSALSPISLSENNDDEHNEFYEKHLENKPKYSFQHSDCKAQPGIKK